MPDLSRARVSLFSPFSGAGLPLTQFSYIGISCRRPAPVHCWTSISLFHVLLLLGCGQAAKESASRPPPEAIQISIGSAVLSLDGNLALASYDVQGKIVGNVAESQKRLVCWDVKHGTVRWGRCASDPLHPVAFLQDKKKYVLIYRPSFAELLDIENGTSIRRLFRDDDKQIHRIAVSKDGKQALVAHDQGSGDSLGLWNLETGELIHSFGNVNALIRALRFSPKGDLALVTYQPLSGNNIYMELWDLVLRKSIRTLIRESHLTDPIAFSPDGKSLFCTKAGNLGKGQVALLDIPSLKEVTHLDGYSPAGLAMTPDGRFLTVVDEKGLFERLEMPSRRLLWAKGNLGKVCAFSDDGKRALAASGYYQPASGGSLIIVTLLDLTTGQTIRKLTDPPFVSIQ